MTDKDSAKAVVLCGAFGGMAPSLLNLAGRFRAEGLLPLDALAGEVVSMALLAVIGCVIVVMFKENTMLKAFFLGVSAPALILNSASALDLPAPPQSREPDTARSGIMLIQPWGARLYAAEQSSIGNRRLTVRTEVPVSGNIFIRDAVSGREREIEADNDGGWTVPTTEFSVVFRGTIAEQIDVETPSAIVASGSEPVVLLLYPGDPEQTFLGGLLDGFGFDNWAQRFVRSEATLALEVEPK
jgi:hypothetical protein